MTTGYGIPAGVEVGGPGVPEPRTGVLKQWSVAVHSEKYGTFRLYYFKMMGGLTMMYNPAKREWKHWRQHRNLVIGKRITLRQARRAVTKLQQVRKIADAIFPVQHSKKVKVKRKR
jgi:hypothetical protein